MMFGFIHAHDAHYISIDETIKKFNHNIRMTASEGYTSTKILIPTNIVREIVRYLDCKDYITEEDVKPLGFTEVTVRW